MESRGSDSFEVLGISGRRSQQDSNEYAVDCLQSSVSALTEPEEALIVAWLTKNSLKA